MTVTRFQVAVPDEVLGDLQERLQRTRFTGASGPAPWAAGTDPGYLRELVAYWADGFDWRAAEAGLNSIPQFTAEIAGRAVHFAHLRGQRAEGAPAPLALIMTHGWPSCFAEMLAVARRLADPGAHGGDPADAFDVVVPSLPGFLYSEPPREPFTRRRVAGIWHELMTGALGYPQFGAFGGDIGGGVTEWLGALYPSDVVGVHVTSALIPGNLDQKPPDRDEQIFLDAHSVYDESDKGYSAIMSTRPDTIAAALMDSPAGLAAWIIDKYRDWSDCGGDLETRWDKDTLLTVATLYWATGSIASSFGEYYHYDLDEPLPDITVPAAVTLTNEPGYAHFPRSLADRIFSDLRHWATPERGGHFMSHEEPGQTARELTEFFRPLRTGDGSRAGRTGRSHPGRPARR